MQTNSSMCMRRVRINVMGVVLSINDRRKRVSGRGLCEPFTKKISPPGSIPTLFSNTKQTLIRQQNAMERRGITCESSESQTVGTVVMTLPFVNKQLDHEAVGYACRLS